MPIRNIIKFCSFFHLFSRLPFYDIRGFTKQIFVTTTVVYRRTVHVNAKDPIRVNKRPNKYRVDVRVRGNVQKINNPIAREKIKIYIHIGPNV